jgi:hypothetical protein
MNSNHIIGVIVIALGIVIFFVGEIGSDVEKIKNATDEKQKNKEILFAQAMELAHKSQSLKDKAIQIGFAIVELQNKGIFNNAVLNRELDALIEQADSIWVEYEKKVNEWTNIYPQ